MTAQPTTRARRHGGRVRPGHLRDRGAVRRAGPPPPRQPRRLGGRAAGGRVAGRARVLARAPPRGHRIRPQAAAAVLLLAGRHPDPRPGQPGNPPLRPPDDAEHGPARALAAPADARAILHSARGGPAGRADPRPRAGDRRAGLPRARRGVRLRQGRGLGSAAADPGRHAGDARPGPVAAVRLVQPGHRLPGPGLRDLGRVRPVRRHADGPRGARAAARARARRPDARPADPRGHAGSVRVRAPARAGETAAAR